MVNFKEFLKDAEPFALYVKTPYKNEWKSYYGVYQDCRLDKTTLPKNCYAYDIRESDSGRYFNTLEDRVIVNFSGTVIFLKPVNYSKWIDNIPLYNQRMVEFSINDEDTFDMLKGTVLELEE